jgi:putative MFS transporter
VIGPFSVFWLLLIFVQTIGCGGWPAIAPYAAEVCPSALRAAGNCSAYGFGGIDKIIAPAGLALVIGSSNTINPEVALDSDHPRLFLPYLSVRDCGRHLLGLWL